MAAGLRPELNTGDGARAPPAGEKFRTAAASMVTPSAAVAANWRLPKAVVHYGVPKLKSRNSVGKIERWFDSRKSADGGIPARW
jgi:hypothetical protein